MFAIAPGWEVDVQRGPDWLLVKVRSEAQRQPSPETDEFALGIWDLMQRHFAHRLVLDMDEVGLLSSHLIGQLLHLYTQIRERDGVMRICGLSPHNLRVLRACRLDDRLLPYQDCKEAVLGHGRAVHPR